jgi:hypothetical protein
MTAVVPGAAPLAQSVRVESGDARKHDLGLGPIDLTGDADDGTSDETASHGSTGTSSRFSPGLHPVAMVRGGTGIAGVPTSPASTPNGNGVARPGGREED